VRPTAHALPDQGAAGASGSRRASRTCSPLGPWNSNARISIRSTRPRCASSTPSGTCTAAQLRRSLSRTCPSTCARRQQARRFAAWPHERARMAASGVPRLLELNFAFCTARLRSDMAAERPRAGRAGVQTASVHLCTIAHNTRRPFTVTNADRLCTVTHQQGGDTAPRMHALLAWRRPKRAGRPAGARTFQGSAPARSSLLMNARRGTP